jgi:hypothetical protein
VRFNLKNAVAGVALCATLATVTLIMGGATSASAATDNGAATITPTSGDSGTDFTLGLGATPSCPGDSAAGGYRVQSFMIPAAADIDSTLTFGGSGPTAVGSELREPLFDTTTNPYVNELTDQAVSPATTGRISGVPAFDWGVHDPGEVPAGSYSVGIACSLGPAGASQLVSYWSTTIEVTTTGVGTGGPAQFTWEEVTGEVPAAPVLASPLGTGSGSLTATFTQPGTPDPAVTGYTATATPTAGGSAVTATGATSPITISGLTNGTSYDVTVHGTNTVGDSPESNEVTGTPALPAVYKVDGEIRRSTQPTFVGNGVYNATGAGQTRATNVRRTRTGQFIVRIRNEANTTDSIKVKGTAGNSRFTVRYFNGAANVTNQVVAGTFRFNGMAANATRNLTVKVTVARTTPLNTSRNLIITSTSVGNPTKKDAVKASVKAIR